MTPDAAKQWTLAALLFAIVAVVPMWRCVLYGEVFVPGAMSLGFEPWKEETGEAWDILRWDSVAQFYPWRKFLFFHLASGHVPLWNRNELLGTPFLANSQSGVFYPLHWVLAPLGAGWGITVAAFLHLMWAGLGCYVLCRRLGCGWGPATLAGVTFELSQWVIAWLQLASVPTTVAWIPWLLAAVHRVWSLPNATAAVRLACCSAMLLLAGHLQIASYGIGAALVFALFLVSSGTCQQPRRRVVGAWSGGMALGVALAAVQLLPVLEMGRLSHRSTSPSSEGYQAYVRLAMPTALVGLAVDPYTAGNPRMGTAMPNPEIGGAYWGPEPLPEYSAYVGLTALVLAGYSVLRICTLGSCGWALLTIGIGAWLLALGTDLNRLLYFGIPGWAATGSPARVLCLAALAGAVLAGLGLEQMVRDGRELPADRRRALGVSLVVATGLLSGGLLWWVTTARPLASPSIETASVSRGLMLPLLAMVLLVLAWAQRPWGGKGAIAAGIVVQIALLAPFAADYNSTSKSPDIYPSFAGLERLQEAAPYRVAIVNGDRWNRYIQPPALLPPNSAMALGFDEVGGYDSLILKSTKERLLDALNGEDSAVMANGNMLFVKPGVMERTDDLADTGVRYALVCSLDAGTADGEPLLVELQPAPMAEVSGVAADLQWTSPNGFLIRSGVAGPAMVRVAAAPGWVVHNGMQRVPVGRAEPSWLAVDLPEALTVSHWRYEPSTYRVGLFLTLLGVAMVSGIATGKGRVMIKNRP
ncbi:MAG: hypothetical protein HRF45_04105 [Fimbriimonadia bacterium]